MCLVILSFPRKRDKKTCGALNAQRVAKRVIEANHTVYTRTTDKWIPAFAGMT
jgi:hypothetical protein